MFYVTHYQWLLTINNFTFFFISSLQYIFYSSSTSQFRLSIYQMLTLHVRLVANVLNNTDTEGMKETVWESLVTLALSHALPPASGTKTPWLCMELRSNLNRIKYSPLAGGLVDFVWFGWHGLEMKLQLNILCNFVCILNCLTLRLLYYRVRASQVVLVVKNLPANTGDLRDPGSVPGSGRSPGEGNGDPLQYSCLENPMDRGAWWATVHGVAKSRARLKWLTAHAHCIINHLLLLLYGVLFCSGCHNEILSTG